MQSKEVNATARQKTGQALLITFEGLDGSGKSTQLKIFKHWLTAQGYSVVTTKWKSSPLLAPYIKVRKEKKSLSPEELSLLHMADLFLRLEHVILPSLDQGKIVLCDRYVFTSLARDAARGVDTAWLSDLCRPVVQPDLAFYFSIAPEASLQRITVRRDPKYYEAGQDVTQMADARQSYLAFGRRVMEQYEAMADRFHFMRVDAARPIEVQQRYIRRVFQEALARRYPPGPQLAGQDFSPVVAL